jgi:hypothetical protein
MQLHVARLCMDCDEIHDAQKCPLCGSETFAYISRWIPAPERRQRPRNLKPPDTVNTYRQLLSPPPSSSGLSRWLRRGAVGIAAVTAVGWAFGRRPRPSSVGNVARAHERRTPPRT